MSGDTRKYFWWNVMKSVCVFEVILIFWQIGHRSVSVCGDEVTFAVSQYCIIWEVNCLNVSYNLCLYGLCLKELTFCGYRASFSLSWCCKKHFVPQKIQRCDKSTHICWMKCFIIAIQKTVYFLKNVGWISFLFCCAYAFCYMVLLWKVVRIIQRKKKNI